jgi:LysM repeat protein
MNQQSPLVPQGSNLEQKNKGRTRVKIAVFFVLAVHGIGLLALLVQGCRQEPKTEVAAADTNTVAPPAFEPPTNTSAGMTPAQVTAPAAAPVVEPTTPTAQTGTATDYKVVKGDIYSHLATKFAVTSKAIADANPGVDANKLQIGQTLHIPAPTKTVAATAASSTTPAAAESASGEHTYKVQSGDTLTKIAKDHGTTVKAIRAANNLKTDRITVGQSLKVPAKTVAAAASAPAVTAPVMETATTSPTLPPGAPRQ